MAFYLIILLALLIGTVLFDIMNRKAGSTLWYCFCFVLLVLLAGLRYNVGGDAQHYHFIYQYMPNLNEFWNYYVNENPLEYQPGWLLFVAACRSVTEDFVFYQFAHAVLFTLSLFIFINNYTNKKFTYLFILFGSLIYIYYSFEVQRETLAVSVFLFNIKNLNEKRWVRYYLLALLSFSIHISATVLFILPLFQYIKLNTKIIYTTIVASLALLLFKKQLILLIEPLLLLESMQNKAKAYSEIEFSIVGLFAYYFVRVVLFIPILLLALKNKEWQKFNWFFTSYFIFSILSQYFVAFERLLNYLNLLYLIFIVNIIYSYLPYYNHKYLKKVVLFITFLHVFFTLEYKLFIVNKYGQHYYSLFYPYVSVMDPYEVEERKLFFQSVYEQFDK